MIKLTHDRIIKEIPYALICEAREGAHWHTGTRKRRWNEMFTAAEKRACQRLFKNAYDWALVYGAPKEIVMQRSTFELWQKLGEFCASL